MVMRESQQRERERERESEEREQAFFLLASIDASHRRSTF